MISSNSFSEERPRARLYMAVKEKTLEWRWKENLGCAPLVFITFSRPRNWVGQKFWLCTGHMESYFSTFDNILNKALVLSDLAQLLAYITLQLADWGNCLKCASRVQNVMEFPQGAVTAVLRTEMRFYQKQVIDKCWFVYFKVLYLPGANLPPGGWDGLGEMEVPALNTAPLFHMWRLVPIHKFWLSCRFSVIVIGATLDLWIRECCSVAMYNMYETLTRLCIENLCNKCHHSPGCWPLHSARVERQRECQHWRRRNPGQHQHQQ